MRRALIAFACLLCWFPILVQAIRLVSDVDAKHSIELFRSSGQVSEQLVVSIFALMVIVTTGTVIIEVVRLIALHGLRDAIRQAGGRTLTGLVLLGIASIMNVVRGNPVEREDNGSHTQSLALEQVTAGLSAALILNGIREARRRQIMLAVGDDVPAKLSEQSMETAMLLVSAQGRQLEVSGELHAKVSRLCDEVMKYESLNATALPCSQWRVIVRLYGFPLVEDSDGAVAEFRKARALELMSWLVLNRDRMRRSAARTAMWEMNCTDATFSTVVSDLRRSLSCLVSSPSEELLPITFSDELPLSGTVCSDFDLLIHHHRQFRMEPVKHRDDVVTLLRGVRDLPFAGTSYLWPDLDGSTTRLVVTAVSAAQDLATWALEAGDPEALMVSTTAGLRLLPGDEQLLKLQRSTLASR